MLKLKVYYPIIALSRLKKNSTIKFQITKKYILKIQINKML